MARLRLRRGTRGLRRTTKSAKRSEFLTKERVNVAREAGPYHVVHFLVSLRMAVLAELDGLDTGQIETLRRMVGFRRKWSSYDSEHGREHTQTRPRLRLRQSRPTSYRRG